MMSDEKLVEFLRDLGELNESKIYQNILFQTLNSSSCCGDDAGDDDINEEEEDEIIEYQVSDNTHNGTERVKKYIGLNGLIASSLSTPIKQLTTNNDDQDNEFIIISLPDVNYHDLSLFISALFNYNFQKDDSKYREKLKSAIKNLSHIFDKLMDIDEENRVEGGGFSVNCHKCDKTFSCPKYMKRHCRALHGLPPHKNKNICRVCYRKCRSNSELIIHMRIHTKEKPHECYYCKKAFKQKSQLNDHITNVHNKNINTGNYQSKNDLQRPTETKNEQQIPHKKCSRLDYDDDNNKIKESKFLFECEICFKKFTQKSHLNVHVKTVHSNFKPFMCPQCGRQFSVASNMKKHMLNHEQESLDDLLDDIYMNSDDIELSVGQPPSLHPPPPSNSISNQLSSKEEEAEEGHNKVLNEILTLEEEHHQTNLGKIILNKEENRSHICEYCGKSFSKLQDLISHAKVQHTTNKSNKSLILNSNLYVCQESLCKQSFSSNSALKIHEKTHTGEPIFNCHICDRICLTKSALEVHSLIHTGERPHKCDFCDKSFVQKSQVNYHMKTVHGPKDASRPKNYLCYICNNTYCSSSALNKHLRIIHRNERNFKCEICLKTFTQKAHLQTHMLKHSGERPFLCFCGKSFTTKSNMKEHSKVHNGEKKTFNCTYCPIQYNNVNDLKIHLRRHTGELPFTCLYCSKGFRSKRNLDNHMRTHTGQKPFRCHNCHKSFSASAGLRQHFKRHGTCRLTASTGAYAMKTDNTIMENSLPPSIQPSAPSLHDHLNDTAENHSEPLNFIYPNNDIVTDGVDVTEEAVLVDLSPVLNTTSDTQIISNLVEEVPIFLQSQKDDQDVVETLSFSIPVVTQEL